MRSTNFLCSHGILCTKVCYNCYSLYCGTHGTTSSGREVFSRFSGLPGPVHDLNVQKVGSLPYIPRLDLPDIPVDKGMDVAAEVHAPPASRRPQPAPRKLVQGTLWKCHLSGQGCLRGDESVSDEGFRSLPVTNPATPHPRQPGNWSLPLVRQDGLRSLQLSPMELEGFDSATTTKGGDSDDVGNGNKTGH